ncbi:MAG TPA: NAD-dependent succinate-semialdehyde dehydrogenase [Solirubrobacterales bacterium]|nr:NAD-dependent succinate-semialdehyde dehydrogenase [Solirubrobacterales bacterium]
MPPLPTEAQALACAPPRLLIGGEWVEAEGSRTLAVEDPATGEVLGAVADATPTDAEAAIAAADAAFQSFRHSSPRFRAEILRRAFEAMTERSEELALLMTLEMGKPLAEARTEVAYAAGFLRWNSEEAVRIGGGYARGESGAGRVLTMRQPVGPCLLITPWNFPLAMGARKLAPAIATGCTAILKPAQQTPFSTLALARILEEAGLPGGVVNVLTSSSSAAVTEPLFADGRLRKLSFTGSTEVGRLLIARSAAQVLRVSMELGGNAPFIVFADADLDAAVEGAMAAKMRNGGEACTAANRLYVHESLAAEFSSRLAARMGALAVGRGTEPGVEVGPLIDEAQRTKVEELVADAVGRGATPLAGGKQIDRPGYFFQPTVLADVPADARLAAEEIFGPVAPVIPFATDAEVIAAANDTEYGLVAYVFTRDLERAFEAVERLDVGMVGLNQGIVANVGAPFGGVKHSGFGREGGSEGIDEYLETKYVALNAGVTATVP